MARRTFSSRNGFDIVTDAKSRLASHACEKRRVTSVSQSTLLRTSCFAVSRAFLFSTAVVCASAPASAVVARPRKTQRTTHARTLPAVAATAAVMRIQAWVRRIR